MNLQECYLGRLVICCITNYANLPFVHLARIELAFSAPITITTFVVLLGYRCIEEVVGFEPTCGNDYPAIGFQDRVNKPDSDTLPVVAQVGFEPTNS